jgi:hypothetical protein
MAAVSGDAVQRKPAAIQRQGNTKGPAPAPFYQYQDGTTHNNDCGPASLLTVLRMLHAEDQLKLWIIAHRPTAAALLQLLAAMPTLAILVARWCTSNLLGAEEMRSFWANTDPATRGADLGQLAVQLGRLEFMLGWIQQGGLSIETTVGWETTGTAADNLSSVPDDESSNRGAFPGRYQAIYNGGSGMAGYDWCGMFVGYLYQELLKLDDASMGSGGIEGWRGADTVLQSGQPRTGPIRDLTAGAGFGRFTGWDNGEPRAGDVLVISTDAFTEGIGNAALDTRTPTHVSMVEEATADYVRTIDGNSALLTTPIDGSSAGSQAANAVSGRGYSLAAQFTDRADEVYHYNQSRIMAAVRITDRANNFEAPASTTPLVTAAELQARVVAACTQVEAVLNSLSGTTTPFSSQHTVREWARDQGA